MKPALLHWASDVYSLSYVTTGMAGQSHCLAIRKWSSADRCLPGRTRTWSGSYSKCQSTGWWIWTLVERREEGATVRTCRISPSVCLVIARVTEWRVVAGERLVHDTWLRIWGSYSCWVIGALAIGWGLLGEAYIWAGGVAVTASCMSFYRWANVFWRTRA